MFPLIGLIPPGLVHHIVFWLYVLSLFRGVYYLTKIFYQYPQRVRDYQRLYEMFSENPNNIKKSILYMMNTTACWSEVVKQLQEDFNIEL